MLMLDVRNAITSILDRYSLADVVEVTLRKMRRDGVPLPFADPRPLVAGGPTDLVELVHAACSPRRWIDQQSLGDYAI